MWDRAQSCGVQVRRIPISDETLTQKQKKKGKKQTQHQDNANKRLPFDFAYRNGQI